VVVAHEDDARNGFSLGPDAPEPAGREDLARDSIAQVAAHDVRHMLSRSGLHEIVELARSVADERGPQESETFEPYRSSGRGFR
jgi:hypothetical protein